MTGLTVLAPLTIEAAALQAAVPGARIVRAGMGPRWAAETAARVASDGAAAVAVAGVCGAVGPDLRAGDVVLASELRTAGGDVRPVVASPLLAAELRRLGLRVHVGPIMCADRIMGPAARAAAARAGAIAVDMESFWLAGAAAGRPLAVLRVVVDEPGHRLAAARTAVHGVRALRNLRRAGPALARWGAALGPRSVLLAGPRSFCAGVERAIGIVERALELRGAPIYVRKQIVHNAHVVSDLERRGAVFVEELAEVPVGATVVFSAHGVSPAVREQAGARGLDVIDATCPLVNKVHAEARRFAAQGNTIFLVGHRGHEEVEGTTGEAPAAIRLVETEEDAERITVDDPERVSFLTQTTLSVDEAMSVVDTLRERFPALTGPSTDDICYATHNRQGALKTVATEADLVLVVGSDTSSNSRRLVEVSERLGTPAHLIDDETEIPLSWLAGAGVVGLTAGASAPEELVQRVIDALRSLGPVAVEERTIAEESTRFALPREVR